MAESAKDTVEIDETRQKIGSVDIGGQEDVKVTYYLRDIERKMVDAWAKIFKDHTDRVKVFVIMFVQQKSSLCKNLFVN